MSTSWNEIEVEENNIGLIGNEETEEETDSEHSFASADTVNIDDISHADVSHHGQLHIDIDHPRLIDNPRDTWWVSDLPP